MFNDRIQTDVGLERFGELLAAAQSLDDVVAALSESARQVIGCDGIAVVLRENGCCHYVAENALSHSGRANASPLKSVFRVGRCER